MLCSQFCSLFTPLPVCYLHASLEKSLDMACKRASDESTRALRPLLSRRGSPSIHYSCGLCGRKSDEMLTFEMWWKTCLRRRAVVGVEAGVS